jgi:hypothetical protein
MNKVTTFLWGQLDFDSSRGGGMMSFLVLNRNTAKVRRHGGEPFKLGGNLVLAVLSTARDSNIVKRQSSHHSSFQQEGGCPKDENHFLANIETFME